MAGASSSGDGIEVHEPPLDPARTHSSVRGEAGIGKGWRARAIRRVNPRLVSVV
jgi:hypothetical protein